MSFVRDHGVRFTAPRRKVLKDPRSFVKKKKEKKNEDFLAARARDTREREKEGKRARGEKEQENPLPRRRGNCRGDRRGFTVFLSNSRSKVSARVWFVCVYMCHHPRER